MEGTIGSERIIKMLNVVDDQLVVEEKGMYSIENFLNARRLMYWQVYLHKASVSAESMLISLMKRAKKLTQSGGDVAATPALKIFLEQDITVDEFEKDHDLLDVFGMLDDADIWGSIKFWAQHDDFVMKILSQNLLRRKLFKIELSNEKIAQDRIKEINKTLTKKGFDPSHIKYFVQKGSVSNAAYVAKGSSINILTKSGEVVDVASATDLPNIKAISKIVKKYYLSYPKDIYL